MSIVKNFWKNDWGFIWLLGFTLLAIIITQFSGGAAAWMELLLVRFCLFLFTIVVIASSMLSLHQKRMGYLVAIALMVLAFILTRFSSQVLIIAYGTLMALYVLMILVLLVKQIFDGGKMTVQKIGGGVAAYILVGHLWASLYLTIFNVNPAAFLNGGELIHPGQALRQLSYFSFVTLTTIGYGDITPMAPFSKTLVIFEGLIGQLFPAIFIAKLVSLNIQDARKD
jgi:hypothetical protein